jgi:hypothetical protein
MQSLEEVLYLLYEHVLVDRVVVHALSEPVDVDDVVLQDVVVESAVEVAVVLEGLDVDVPD